MPKYDDASWHFSNVRPDVAAYTHIAFFFTWCVSSELAADQLAGETESDRKRLIERRITPSAYMVWIECSKLTHNELKEAGTAFSTDYYSEGAYLADYANVFCESSSVAPPDNLTGRARVEAKRNAIRKKMTRSVSYKTIYEVPDTWKSYDRIARVLDRRYQEWSSGGLVT